MTGRTAKELLRIVLFFHAVIWVIWLFYAFGVAPSAPERDWFILHAVGKSFLSGDWASIYADREVAEGTMFFRYPPFVLYALAPLAVLPALAAYALICAVQLAAAIATLVVLFRIKRPEDAGLNVAAVFGSAAMAHVIVTGQNSALLALVVAVAGFLWSRGRNLLAAIPIGLIACKPNWLPVFGLATIWRGGVRAGMASATVVAALILSSLPLGARLWQDFITVTTRSAEIETRLPVYKEITLLAALRSILGWTASTQVLWAVAVAVLVVLVIRALRDARPFGRSLALLTLLSIVGNPYAHFYDGFLLVIPGTMWYAHRDAYPERSWWITGAWIAAYWLWDMTVFYYAPFVPALQNPRLSAAGILLTGWLVTEAVAMSRAAIPPEPLEE